MLLKNVHVSTAFYHIPIFSSLTVPSAHPHVHCVLVQHSSLIGINVLSAPSSEIYARDSEHPYTHTHRSDAPTPDQFKLLCLVLGTICSPDTWSEAPEINSASPSLDTKIPLDLTSWERLTSHSSIIHL